MYCITSIVSIPYHVCSDVIKDINWSVAQSSFSFTVQALNFNTYSYRVLLGLVISVGGLTESLVS